MNFIFSSFFSWNFAYQVIKCKIRNEEAKALFLREDVGDKFYRLLVDFVVHVMLILVW